MPDLAPIVARFEKSPVRPYCEQMLMAALFLRVESLRYQQLKDSLVSAFGDGARVADTLREAPYQFAEHGFFDDVLEAKTVRALWEALLGMTAGGIPIVHSALKLEERVERLLNEELSSILTDVAALDLSACLTDGKLLGRSFDAALQSAKRPSRALSATPPELAGLMAKLLAPQTGEKIYDPACGCGECLLAMDRAADGGAKVYGQDFSASTSAFAELRLRFYGYNAAAEIHHGNTLREPQCEGPFQVLVTEPPFGTFREDNEGSPARFEDKFIRHLVLEGRMDPKDGRAAVVVPYNFLYNRTLADLRKSLVGQNLLDAVIRLPRNLLFGSSVQTYLLVFKANRGDRKDVCFIDASRKDFSERVVGRNVLTDAAIEQIVKAYLTGEEQSGFVWHDSIEHCLSDGGYSFDDPRFPSYQGQARTHLSVDEIEKRIRSLTDELASLTALRGF